MNGWQAPSEGFYRAEGGKERPGTPPSGPSGVSRRLDRLIAELRACRANLNDFVDATTYYRERAERAEAELALGRDISNAAVAEAEERAERAEARIAAALDLHFGIQFNACHCCANDLPCPTRRALTGDDQ